MRDGDDEDADKGLCFLLFVKVVNWIGLSLKCSFELVWVIYEHFKFKLSSTEYIYTTIIYTIIGCCFLYLRKTLSPQANKISQSEGGFKKQSSLFNSIKILDKSFKTGLKWND